MGKGLRHAGAKLGAGTHCVTFEGTALTLDGVGKGLRHAGVHLMIAAIKHGCA